MIIMALDHVREFWGPTGYRAEDLTQTSVLLFATRWVTHLCAPTFLFLSGISIYLYLNKVNSLKKTSYYLLTRGVWLILMELMVISFIMTQGYDLTVLEVVWVFGWSMILLAGLIYLPRLVLVVISVGLIAFHNLVPNVQAPADNLVLALLHNSPFFIPAPPTLVAYPLIPWAAVMLAGFTIGNWFVETPEKRDSRLLIMGAFLLTVFIVLRLANAYGDPSIWKIQDRGLVYTLLSFLNVTKQPPSLLFLSVTLGISFFLLVAFSKLRGRITKILVTYGQVPFFYFVIHFAVISFSSYVWSYFKFGKGVNLAFSSAKDLPSDYEPSLLRVYLVWVVVLALLYFPCMWFAAYKRRRKNWWTSLF